MAKTIIHKNNEFKADAITVQKTFDKPNVKLILNAEIVRVDGEVFVNSLTYRDKTTNEESTIPTGGIFVEIGQYPSTDFAKDVINLTPINTIIVDPMNQRTETAGIWAAGDCTNGLYHQNNIAAGDAVKAIEDIYQFIQRA